MADKDEEIQPQDLVPDLKKLAGDLRRQGQDKKEKEEK